MPLHKLINELIEFGYMSRQVVRNEKGQIQKTVYELYEEPMACEPTPEEPQSEPEPEKPFLVSEPEPEKPDTVKPDTANPPLINIKYNKQIKKQAAAGERLVADNKPDAQATPSIEVAAALSCYNTLSPEQIQQLSQSLKRSQCELQGFSLRSWVGAIALELNNPQTFKQATSQAHKLHCILQQARYGLWQPGGGKPQPVSSPTPEDTVRQSALKRIQTLIQGVLPVSMFS